MNTLLKHFSPFLSKLFPKKLIFSMSNFQSYRKNSKKIDDDLDKKYGGSKNLNVRKPAPVGHSATTSGRKQGQEKFVPLFGDQGQEKLVAKLPGSHKCDCQASVHKLINNCLSCGKIVCDQEGSGACYFCGAMVCTPKEQEILQNGGRAADDLRKKLLFSSKNRSISCQNSISESPFSLSTLGQDLEKATSDKDQLLQYQENNIARTKVYDDQSDYYTLANCQWLSKEEREFLRIQNEKMDEQKRRENSRLNRKITVDLCGMTAGNYENEPKSCENFVEEMKTNFNFSMQSNIGQKPQAPMPVYQYHLRHNQQNIAPKNTVIQNTVTRLQDLGYKEVQDAGLCLSMHQPYASLLVRGIKKVEGRSWYINHRGVLWIAATAKQPDKATIGEVENFYEIYYGGNLPAPFPDNYSTGCLVGCVTLTDCLSQEQYRSLYPDGESESPFVAICQDPRELRLKFPISGQHKIYKLDPLLHTAVKKGIEW